MVRENLAAAKLKTMINMNHCGKRVQLGNINVNDLDVYSKPEKVKVRYNILNSVGATLLRLIHFFKILPIEHLSVSRRNWTIHFLPFNLEAGYCHGRVSVGVWVGVRMKWKSVVR